MTRPKSRLSGVAAVPPPSHRYLPLLSRIEFYREEFLRHQRCLQHQRESFSERAITDVECALSRILAQLDQLCGQDDAERVLAALLKKFDAVTRLSAFTEPRTLH
jgi:hypothetical protein